MSAIFKLILLGWLYFIQGIPYGIQDKFIPLHMRLQNFNFSKVSLMKSLLLPWLCKGIWAPFTQIYFTPKLWLIFSVFGLSLISFIGSSVSSQNISGIAVVLFLMNVFSAVQDIIVDGFALSCLYDSQLGLGNSLQVVLYKVGSLFGGAGLIYLSSFTGWSTTFICLSLFYLVSTAFIFCLPEMKSFQRQKFSQKCEHEEPCYADIKADNINQNYEIVLEEKNNSDNLRTCSQFSENILICPKKRNKAAYIILKILRDVFQTKKMIWLCIYISFYKMGERGAINNFPLYLLDNNISPKSLAFWNGIVCQIVSIIGSIVGGVLLTSKLKNKTIEVLKTHTIHRFVSIAMCYCIIIYCNMQSVGEEVSETSFAISILTLLYLNYTSGVISTATFTLMMEASRKLDEDSQATHYSVLASIEIAGKLIFSSFAGFLIDSYGMDNSFLVFSVLSLIPFILLSKEVK